jgi:hypothetical protein
VPRSKNVQSAIVICCAFLFFSSCVTVRDFSIEEKNTFFTFEPNTRTLINSPAVLDNNKPVQLILYALPNGNSIEMTAGKKTQAGMDWHYDIQHIAAQTRFLRSELFDRNIIVAYLESEGKSWPAWRQKFPDNSSAIARIVNYVRFECGNPMDVILCGHSGGGSFITGFINGFDTIPSFISRIVYLDANYSFDDSLQHGKKLFQWLLQDSNRTLVAIAYDDRNIVFNGKKVIGPAGGTYRATHRMIQSFAERTEVAFKQDSTIQQYSALNNHARFIIHSNPDTLILHTVLVERNGFIHSMLLNTDREERNYKFYGDRAYNSFISEH